MKIINNIITLRNIYILATIHCLILIIVCGVEWYEDTPSYIEAWDSILHSQIDIWRTPTYPIILGFLNTIFGSEYYLFSVTIIQHITFLISIYFFHQLVLKVINTQAIATYFTAFYAIYPSIATWNCFVLTESFAIYGMVFLLYCAYNAYLRNSQKYIIGFAFWSLFLIFLRPSQVYILPVFFIGWLLLFFKKKKITRVITGGIISVCVSTFLLLYYCHCYKSNYGIFSPSGIGVVNKYYMARMNGIIRPEHANNKELYLHLTKRFNSNGNYIYHGTTHDLYVETFEFINIYGLEEISALVSNANRSSCSSSMKRILQRFHKATNDSFFVSYIPKWKALTDFFSFNLKIIYLLLIVYPTFIFIWIKKKTKIPWFSITLFMLGFCHLSLIIITCQNSWDRLIMPIAPVYLLMIGQLFYMFTITKKTNTEFV